MATCPPAPSGDLGGRERRIAGGSARDEVPGEARIDPEHSANVKRNVFFS